MADAPRRKRVAIVFETPWDRKQLEACRSEWEDTIEVVFPEPNDDCAADFDVLGFIERAAAGGLGRLDGVISSSDYPGATVAAAISTRLGLPGSRPEHVLGASHKYYSRVAQARAVPEAVPAFALLDPRDPPVKPPLPLPCFVKPVKGAYSVLARRIDDAAALRAFLGSPEVHAFTHDYLAIFNRLVAEITPYDVDGHYLLAEELLSGELVTVEGWVCDGRVHVLGVVDSVLHPNRSFARFDYPSALPADVQARMADIAARAVGALGLERTLFNIEMTWDAEADRIAIVEVNPRICGQFGDLYRKVDGRSSYSLALELCTGGTPRIERGAGPYAVAASVPLRVFEPVRVLQAPAPSDVSAAEALAPDTLVWSECNAGDVLDDFGSDEDGGSHRYAVINLGAPGRAELQERLNQVQDRLAYRMRPIA